VSDSPSWPRPRREPIFNIAPGVLGLAVALVGIHLVRELALNQASDTWVVLAFSFIPWRETADLALTGVPGGNAARVWSVVTYALLHANWTHVLFNVLWMVAFGSPLAWRFGTVRFLLFTAVGAVAGALLHFVFYPDSMVPMVGASAAISAHMAGVSRFAFGAGGGPWGQGGGAVHRLPAPPLRETFRNPRVLAFVGIWFATNLIFGISGLGSGIASGAVAWDAHLGGFIAGLVFFSLFDRR
jgi:membrane associated rhomboid family serine protease